MAEELQVLVEQEVGVISWNFDQLKAALAVKMQEYDGLVYTEDNVKVAKTDIATLRKIKKAISDKRIEIKKKCLEPYEVFEAQAGELTELIDKPINQIDAQLTEYENNRREAVRVKIMAHFDYVGKVLPAPVLERVKALKYRGEWENATTAMKRWKQGVEDAVRATERDLLWIDETVEEEFWEAAREAYNRNLVLADVMTEVTKLRKQKEMILAKERERIAAEERAKAEAEMKAREREQAQADTPKTGGPEANLKVREHPEFVRNEPQLDKPQPTPQIAEKGPSRTEKGDMAEIYSLRIRATGEQIRKIKGYINYVGAVYREEM